MRLKMTIFQVFFNFRIHYKNILIWTLIIVGFVIISLENIKQSYPDQKSLDDIYNIMQMPLMFMLFGNFNYQLPNTQATQFITETAIVTYILIAIMNILLSIKMTRQKEDEGITDLVLTTKAPRLSPTASVYLIMFILNILICLLIFLSLTASPVDSMTPKGNIMFTLSVFTIGFIFQNIAFLMSELASNASNAKSLSFFIFGGLFILRMFIDYRFVNLQIISPLSWGGSINPYGNNNPNAFYLGLFISFIILGISLFVNHKRDIGAGIIREFKGPANASKLLNNPYYFRFKLNRNSIITWIVIVIILGLLFGSLVDSINLFSDNPVFQEILQGDSSSITDMMNSLVNIITIMVVNISMLIGLKLFYQIKKEQYSNILDLYYHSKIKRSSIYLSHLLLGIGISTLIFFITMVFMYIGQIIFGNNSLNLSIFLESFINYFPLILFIFTISSLLYVFMAKYSSLTYVLIAIIFSINTIGMMFFDIPDIINKLFITGLLSNSPVEKIDYLPWSLISIISIIILIISGFLYNKKSLNNLMT